MNQLVATRSTNNAVATNGDIMESVLIKGDLSKLTPNERSTYYMRVCESVGLNPLTKPFEYITLNGKLTLYALRTCTDQLRAIHKVSVVELTETDRDGVFIVTAKMQNGDGRSDMAKGAVTINGLKGDALANAIMKAETKAKRRATLSLCGLGFLDETEIETIPAAADRAQTLPKKDSRDIYTKMQAEIDGMTTRANLKAWGEACKQRIDVLPPDWQDHIRLRYHEKMTDLQYHETKPKADALGGNGTEDIPPGLKRNGKMPNPNDNIDLWLLWLDGKLQGCDTGEKLETFWNDNIAPILDGLIPPDQEAAYGLYRRHETRLAP